MTYSMDNQNYTGPKFKLKDVLIGRIEDMLTPIFVVMDNRFSEWMD